MEAAAAEVTEAGVWARGGAGAEGEWLPAPAEAQALCRRVLSTLPSLLPTTLDCIASLLARPPAQQDAVDPTTAAPSGAGAGSLGAAAAAAAPLPPPACSSTGSRVLDAWLLGLQGRGREAGTGEPAPAPAPAPRSARPAPPVASWVAAAVHLLEGVLGSLGGVRQRLVEEEEARCEAALAACEAGVAALEREAHPSAGGLRQAVARAGALLANLFGRDL